MRDLHCFLMKDNLSSKKRREDLNKLFISKNFKKLRQKQPSGQSRISCYIKRTDSEIYPGLGNLFQVHESIRVKFYLIYMVSSRDRVFLIADKNIMNLIDDIYIQWDFALKIALEAQLPGKRIENIGFPFSENYISSIDQDCSGKNLETKFRKKSYLIFTEPPLVPEMESYCSYLYSIYSSELDNPYFIQYKKINYMADPCIFSQFERALRKEILSKNSNKILITYPSENIFDSEGFDFCNGKVRREYLDVGICELQDYFCEIEKENGDQDLKKIMISPLNKNREWTEKHSLMDLIIFEFAYLQNNYIYRNNTIYRMN